MPIYTYRCENCEHEFDERQSFSDENLVHCPNCEKEALRRVYKPARVVFKGSGYYVTDNRASKKASSKTKEESSKNGKSETKSTDKKKTKSEKKDKKVKDKSK